MLNILIVVLLSVDPSLCAMPNVKLPGEMGGGITMPILGLGTGGYGPHFRTNAYKFVKEWFQLGGRRIDTALSYGDQDKIAQALKDSGLKREDVFITSKMPCGSTEQTKKSMQQALDELNMEYVDLMLIHFPCDDTADSVEAWKALTALQREGKAKAVGVSNFCVHDLEALEEASLASPSVNQYEYQPYWNPDNLTKYCRDNDIQINNAAPLGAPDIAPIRNHWNSSILELPIITNAARFHKCTPAQVVLSWEYNNNGIVLNPRTNSTQHMKDNLANWWDTVKLTDDEVTVLTELKNNLPAGATSGKSYHAGVCD